MEEMEMSDRPKVSVCMITYQHGPFIRQALESAINQQTNFQYEIVIGEDMGLDDTRVICEEFASRYPETVRLLPSLQNLGMIANFTRTFQACRGELIAFLEGDDYWTDENKLQVQVDFMHTHPECSLSFHSVTVKMDRSDGKKEWTMPWGLTKDVFDTSDLLGAWFIPSASCMFMNYGDLNLPEWYYRCASGDIPLMLLLSQRGPFRFIDRNMGVYRLHDGGVSNTHKGINKVLMMIFIYERFNEYTSFRYQSKISAAIAYEIKKHAVAAPPAYPADAFVMTRPKPIVRLLNRLKRSLFPSKRSA